MNTESNERQNIARDEILSAAILLREDDSEWQARIAAGVIGKVRRRRRRNTALAAVLTFVLGAGVGLNLYYDSQDAAYTDDPYLSLYEGIYADSAAYPEFEDESDTSY